jgi:ATP-dependent protease ClpP protease subunit
MRMTTGLLALLLTLGGCGHKAVASPQAPAVAAEAAVTPPPTPANDVPRFRLYGQLGDQDVIQVATFFGTALAAGQRRVTFEIDSPGGRADAGREIGRLLEAATAAGVGVTCLVDGHASSAAFYVLQSCPAGRRWMTSRSVLMTHEPMGTIQVSATDDVAFENTREALRAEAVAWATHCVARLKVTRAEYDRRTRAGREWFFTAPEALAAGAVDRVVDVLP